MNQDNFRLTGSFEMKPMYISLGLPKSAFQLGKSLSEKPFDTVIECGNKPDCVWFVRGEDFYTFNIRKGAFESGPLSIETEWCGPTMPLAFASGIDAAAWGGPSYPDLLYFFKGGNVIRMNRNVNWAVDQGSMSLQQGGWGSAIGTWLSNGCDAALHGIGTKYDGMVHFFKGSEYIRHNLNTGQLDAGPIPITDVFALAEPFAKGIDLAFYGSGGRDAYKIYFFKGDQCLVYNTKTNETEQISAIIELFPAMTEYIGRPQLFLVENYSLKTFVGPLEIGRVVAQPLFVPPGTEQKIRMVTEVSESSSQSITKSLLESQDNSVVENFYDEMKLQSGESGGNESSQFHFDGSFHGEATGVNSIVGGEVDANARAKGGSDSVRSNFSKAALGTISKQVSKAAKQTSQQVMTADDKFVRSEKTLFESVNIIKNTSATSDIKYQFYEQLQPYIVLLVLNGIQLAYADGTGRTDIRHISAMKPMLEKYIPDETFRSKIVQYVRDDLSMISDYKGIPTSVIKDIIQTGESLFEFNPDIISNYSIKKPNGKEQTITVNGIIKSSINVQAPTYTMVALKDQEEMQPAD